MNTYTQYDIILKSNLEELIIEINKLIKKGWQPIGGVAIDDGYYLQTVAK